ncbi:MAG: hypothetical protein JWP34_5021 [Massilia sp.]|nr:hypothetical protein [Massilia sp.]
MLDDRGGLLHYNITKARLNSDIIITVFSKLETWKSLESPADSRPPFFFFFLSPSADFPLSDLCSH